MIPLRPPLPVTTGAGLSPLAGTDTVGVNRARQELRLALETLEFPPTAAQIRAGLAAAEAYERVWTVFWVDIANRVAGDQPTWTFAWRHDIFSSSNKQRAVLTLEGTPLFESVALQITLAVLRSMLASVSLFRDASLESVLRPVRRARQLVHAHYCPVVPGGKEPVFYCDSYLRGLGYCCYANAAWTQALLALRSRTSEIPAVFTAVAMARKAAACLPNYPVLRATANDLTARAYFRLSKYFYDTIGDPMYGLLAAREARSANPVNAQISAYLAQCEEDDRLLFGSRGAAGSLHVDCTTTSNGPGNSELRFRNGHIVVARLYDPHELEPRPL